MEEEQDFPSSEGGDAEGEEEEAELGEGGGGGGRGGGGGDGGGGVGGEEVIHQEYYQSVLDKLCEDIENNRPSTNANNGGPSLLPAPPPKQAPVVHTRSGFRGVSTKSKNSHSSNIYVGALARTVFLGRGLCRLNPVVTHSLKAPDEPLNLTKCDILVSSLCFHKRVNLYRSTPRGVPHPRARGAHVRRRRGDGVRKRRHL
jgi:hypothetical protein